MAPFILAESMGARFEGGLVDGLQNQSYDFLDQFIIERGDREGPKLTVGLRNVDAAGGMESEGFVPKSSNDCLDFIYS